VLDVPQPLGARIIERLAGSHVRIGERPAASVCEQFL
jgi:hypothetical protein